MIFAHDFSGSSARSICKGFLFAESQPIGIFHQTGIGTLNNFPRIVVRKAHHFQNTLAVHPVFRKDTLLGPNNHIHQWNFAFISDEKIQWQVILQNALICAKILSIFAQVGGFFFTLKALLLCAVPLFRSSSSDLAADYNVSLCGQNENPAAYGALHGDEVSLHSLQLQRNHRMQAEAVCGHIHQMLSGCPKDPFRPD